MPLLSLPPEIQQEILKNHLPPKYIGNGPNRYASRTFLRFINAYAACTELRNAAIETFFRNYVVVTSIYTNEQLTYDSRMFSVLPPKPQGEGFEVSRYAKFIRRLHIDIEGKGWLVVGRVTRGVERLLEKMGGNLGLVEVEGVVEDEGGRAAVIAAITGLLEKLEKRTGAKITKKTEFFHLADE